MYHSDRLQTLRRKILLILRIYATKQGLLYHDCFYRILNGMVECRSKIENCAFSFLSSGQGYVHSGTCQKTVREVLPFCNFMSNIIHYHIWMLWEEKWHLWYKCKRNNVYGKQLKDILWAIKCFQFTSSEVNTKISIKNWKSVVSIQPLSNKTILKYFV